MQAAGLQKTEAEEKMTANDSGRAAHL